MLLLMGSMGISAQKIHHLNVELNVARYAPIPRSYFLRFAPIPPKFTWVNGFNIGYSTSERTSYFIGFRKVNYSVNNIGDLSHLNLIADGIEVRFGTRFSINSAQRVYLSFGIEVSDEITAQKGTLESDHPGITRINKLASYLSLAPSIQLNLRILNNVLLFVDTRFQLGFESSTPVDNIRTGIKPIFNETYYTTQFDPINCLGVRFEL